MINIGDPVNIVPTSLRSSDFYKGTVIAIKEHLYNVQSESGRDAWYTEDELRLNGIERKGVPEHRLINARKIAVNSSVHDYRKAEKPQLPKQDDNMWTWIKKNALKRLLPFVKEVIDIDLDINVEGGVIYVSLNVKVMDEVVFIKLYTKSL